MNIKKTLVLASFSCLLSFSTSNVFADFGALPPSYLSVPHFKRCLGQERKGQAYNWCLPIRKPHGCPRSSWKQLQPMFGSYCKKK